MKNILSIIVILIAIVVIRPLKESFGGFSVYLYSFHLFVLWSALVVLFTTKPAKRLVVLSAITSFLFIYAYTKSISSAVDISFVIFTTSSMAFLCVITGLSLSLKKPFSFIKYPLLFQYFFVIIISIFLIGYYKTTGIINSTGVYAILQSNAGESIDFIADNLRLEYELGFALLVSFSLLLIFFILKGNVNSIDNKVKFLLLILFSLTNSANYTENTLKDIKTIKLYYDNYHLELDKLKALKNKIENHSFIAKAEGEKGFHIVVIGESLAKYNMSAYGYASDTTPWINSSDGIIYSQVYSNHTHTMPSLSLALTGANQYNSKTYFNSPSIISVANKAKFNTAWFSNQIKVGAWDNLVSIISEDADYRKFINSGRIGKTTKTDWLDKDLLPEIEEYISELDESERTVIFVHMIGSHASYCDRTNGEKIILPKQKPYRYINKQNYCYDKSVKYTDEFLESLFKMANKKDGFKTMTFFSDHGEDVFNRLGHNSGNFTEYMAEIPLIIWGAENLDDETNRNLLQNKDKIVTNDLIYNTVIDLLGIDTDVYEKRYSLANPNYNLAQPLTLHGKVEISTLKSQISKRNVANHKNLMAHRVNTVGALIDAKQQNFKRIEVDVFYDGNDIVVGHDKGAVSGISLHAFLKYEKNNFEQIWIDFKNLNSNNFDLIFKELQSLDDEFGIKNRALFESSFKGSELAKLSVSGWRTSYYLPTRALINYKTIKDINAFNSSLIKQIKIQKLSSLSFNARVHDYLIENFSTQALSDLDIELNIWLDLNTSDPDFQSKFDAYSVTSDSLIENVIVQYPTRFRK